MVDRMDLMRPSTVWTVWSSNHPSPDGRREPCIVLLQENFISAAAASASFWDITFTSTLSESSSHASCLKARSLNNFGSILGVHFGHKGMLVLRWDCWRMTA